MLMRSKVLRMVDCADWMRSFNSRCSKVLRLTYRMHGDVIVGEPHSRSVVRCCVWHTEILLTQCGCPSVRGIQCFRTVLLWVPDA